MARSARILTTCAKAANTPRMCCIVGGPGHRKHHTNGGFLTLRTLFHRRRDLVTLAPVIGGAWTDDRRASVQGRLDATGSYKRWVLLTALAGMFATTFPVTLLAVSLSTIADDFETTETLIAWVISAPLLASAVALPILGKLGDLYGHRRVFLTGFTISTVITAITVLAWDPISLIALRGLAVMIGGATIPSSMALINSVYARSERAKAMGWWSVHLEFTGRF